MWLDIWTITLAIAVALSVAAVAVQPIRNGAASRK